MVVSEMENMVKPFHAKKIVPQQGRLCVVNVLVIFTLKVSHKDAKIEEKCGSQVVRWPLTMTPCVARWGED